MIPNKLVDCTLVSRTDEGISNTKQSHVSEQRKVIASIALGEVAG